MSSSLPVPPYIRGLSPYVAGKPISEVAREFGLDESSIVKLASNENPLGMPPSARRAIEAALTEAGRYPDANAFDLKAALSARYGVPADWITLGNGSNDILVLAADAFLQPGKSAVYSQYGFVVYASATQTVGARSIVVPAAADFGHDLAGFRAALASDTQLVYIANPNNPTGTFLAPAALEAYIADLPPHVMVVLDEAYNEYLPPELRYDSVAWVKRFPNLIVSRTFSKAYGLAGLRIGYAIARPEVTDILNRVRQPFNVNHLAQAAAVAALADTAFLKESYELNRAGYVQLTQAFERLGLRYIPSVGNFVMVEVGSDEGAGARVSLALLKAGVIVRPVANYGLPRWLRITIGLPAENATLIERLGPALAAR